jgi:hypothetical protein
MPPVGKPEGERPPRIAAALRRDRGPRGIMEGLGPATLRVWAVGGTT